MRKVLHVINSFGVGGAERQLVATLPLLDRGEWKHIVSALRPPTTLQPEFEQLGIPALLLLPNRLPAIFQIFKGITALLQLVRQTRPDILHTALFPANIITRFVGRLTGIPVVEHLVNILYDPLWLLEPQFTPRKLAMRRYLDGVTAQWTVRFIAISEAVKKSAVEKLKVSESRITVIPRGVFPEEWTPISRIEHSENLLVATGRLIAQKGHRFLIESMPKVVWLFPQVQLAIIGDGPLREELKNLINQMGLSGKVSLEGRKSHAEIKTYLWQATLFVFPSLLEGLGVALIEVMASGLASVVSDIPALREIVADSKAALIVPSGDVEKLAEGICTLLSSPEERELMGKRAQILVQERFDLRKIAPRWLEVYEQVLAK